MNQEKQRHTDAFIRWQKRNVKSLLLNLKLYQKKSSFSKADYLEEKKRYESLEEDLISEALELNGSISFSLPSHPELIVPDSYISMVGDQMGRIFRYKQHIYRGIYEESIPELEQLWNTGILQVLANHRLIPSVNISNYFSDEFPLVLEVEEVTISKNTVWSFAMIKDACKLICFLKVLLDHYGFSLLDGHLNNVTFHHGSPMFIDIGSFTTTPNDGVLTELVFAGVYRLAFGFIGNSLMYRLPTHDNDNENIFVLPRSHNLMAREYHNALKVLKRYFRVRGTSFQRSLVHRIFDLNVFEPQDIEALFPVPSDPQDETVITNLITSGNALTSHLNLSQNPSVLMIGGSYGVLEEAILKENEDIQFKCMDYIEHRLDLCYMLLKNHHANTQYYLYNYIYLQEHQIQEVKSDIVIAVNPLIDNGAIYPIKDSILWNAISRLSKQYIVILFPSREHQRYNTFFDSELSDRFSCIKTGILGFEHYFKFAVIRVL